MSIETTAVGEGDPAQITAVMMVSMMVGRAITQTFPKVECEKGQTVLEVKNLCHPTEFAAISFSLRKGEILGFYGLVGAGRTELMQALSGVTRPSSGEIVPYPTARDQRRGSFGSVIRVLLRFGAV